MNISIAGTGKMGSAIAARLLGLGHQVTVWNRTPARAQPRAGAAGGAGSGRPVMKTGVQVDVGSPAGRIALAVRCPPACLA